MSILPETMIDAPGKGAVLLVDLQRDFLGADGRLTVDLDTVPELLDCVHDVVAEADAAGVPVVQIVNEFPRWSLANPFRKFAAIEGNEGAEIDPRVPRRDAVVFTKKRSDAFTNAALEAWLRERDVDHLVVLGVFADACVRRTVEGARARGFAVTVPRAGVASRSSAAVERGLRAMSKAGAVTT